MTYACIDLVCLKAIGISRLCIKRAAVNALCAVGSVHTTSGVRVDRAIYMERLTKVE